MRTILGVLTALLYGGVVLAGSMPALVYLFFGQRPAVSRQES